MRGIFVKRTQLNLALVIIALALGLTVYFSQEKEEKGAPLTALTTDSISKVRIEHPGSPAIVLEKTGKLWNLVEPVKTPADSIEIGGVLNLATLETKSTLKLADVQLKELSLEPPQYSVTLNDQKIDFGTTEQLNFRRYLLTGQQLFLADDPPSAALDSDYSDLVSKQLLPEGSEIVELQIPGLTLTRGPDGQEWITNPAKPDASSDAKQKLVDAWKNARSMWNASELDAAAKGETVTIKLKDQSLQFIIAAREPQLMLVRPDLKVRYTLSKALVEELLQLPAPPKVEEKKAAAGSESKIQ